MARTYQTYGRGATGRRQQRVQQAQAATAPQPYQGYTGPYGPGTGSPGGPGTGGTVSQFLQYQGAGGTAGSAAPGPRSYGGGIRPGATFGGGGRTETTQIGPQTTTDRPWDENLYASLVGDVERFRTQALPDISAAQEAIVQRAGMRAGAGLGSGPMARAARAQATEPLYAQFGAQAANRYLQQQALLSQMGRGLLTPYGVRETSGRTDVRTTGPGGGGTNPYQRQGQPIMYKGRMIGRV